MLPPLIVSGWSKASWRRRFEIDALQEPIERQIKIKPSLLAIRDHVQTAAGLIMNRSDRRILLHLLNIGTTEGIQMLTRIL